MRGSGRERGDGGQWLPGRVRVKVGDVIILVLREV